MQQDLHPIQGPLGAGDRRGHWGILFDGACFEGSDGGCDWDPSFARALWFETGRGYVLEIRSVVNPIDKDELLKIAESMPVFDPSGQ